MKRALLILSVTVLFSSPSMAVQPPMSITITGQGSSFSGHDTYESITERARRAEKDRLERIRRNVKQEIERDRARVFKAWVPSPYVP